MKPPAKPQAGSFQAMGLSQDLFRGVRCRSDSEVSCCGATFMCGNGRLEKYLDCT